MLRLVSWLLLFITIQSLIAGRGEGGDQEAYLSHGWSSYHKASHSTDCYNKQLQSSPWMLLQPFFQLTLLRSLISRQLGPCGGLNHCHTSLRVSIIWRSLNILYVCMRVWEYVSVHVCVWGNDLPYSRKLLREKTSAIWQNKVFAEKTFADCSLVSLLKDAMSPNFAEKTFTNSYKTSKFAQLKFSFSPLKVSNYTVSLHIILARHTDSFFLQLVHS